MIINHAIPHTGKNFEKQVMKEKFSLFLLWLISKKEQHGYGIIKTMHEDKALPPITASKIYPLLKELGRKGFISRKKVMQGRRARKVYAITAKGKDAIAMAKGHMKKSRLMKQFLEDMIR